MHFEDGTIVRDQNGQGPGRYGDSCFDSMAFALCYFWSTGNSHPLIDENQFFDEKGQTRRHPKSIWPEMTQDNELPLFMYCRARGFENLCSMIRSDLRARGWRTSNGKLITAAYYAELQNWQWLRCLSQLVQVLFFYFPFYWNDGKWAKQEWPIGNNWARTDGFYQWRIIAHLTPWPFNRLVSRKTLNKKIMAYYRPEIQMTPLDMKDTNDMIISTALVSPSTPQ